MGRRSYSGGAVPTTITGGIDATATSVTLAASTGWPTALEGPFVIVLDKGTANEEKCEVSTRADAVLTISSRGYDGSSAGAHSAGASCEVMLSAIEVNEVNRHAFDTNQDDHTQYLNNTRHAAIAHGTALIADGAITQPKLAKPAVGTPEIIADAVTADKILDGNVLTSKLADEAVTEAKIKNTDVTTPKLRDGAVTNVKLGNDILITETQLADDAVSTDKIVDGAVTQAKHASGLDHIQIAGALPGSPTQGMVVYLTTDNRIYSYDGTNWVLVGGAPVYSYRRRTAGQATFTQGDWIRFSMHNGAPEVDETDSLWSNANQQYEIPANLGGIYSITAGCRWSTPNATQNSLQIRFRTDNGSEPGSPGDDYTHTQDPIVTDTRQIAQQISGKFRLAAGEVLYIEGRANVVGQTFTGADMHVHLVRVS